MAKNCDEPTRSKNILKKTCYRLRLRAREDVMRSYFPSIFGNDFHKNRIAEAVLDQRLPHALLIDGPEGSGKMTFAKEIASALNCECSNDPTRPLPCGRCNTCRRIKEGSYTDVKVLRRTDGKATIGVQLIKDFRSDMFLSATESRYKVYIIDEAEKMTPEAQNALLIVLEEPPKNVVIMLLASGTDSILTTIKSRTQYVTTPRFDTEELAKYLGEISPEARALEFRDPEAYKSLLVSADGRIGLALELMLPKAREENEEARREILAVVKALGKRTPYTELFSAINSLPQKRVEFQEALELLITALADLIASKKSSDFKTAFFTDTESAREMAKDIPIARLMTIYDTVMHTYTECDKNANVTLAATNMASRIKMA